MKNDTFKITAYAKDDEGRAIYDEVTETDKDGKTVTKKVKRIARQATVTVPMPATASDIKDLIDLYGEKPIAELLTAQMRVYAQNMVLRPMLEDNPNMDLAAIQKAAEDVDYGKFGTRTAKTAEEKAREQIEKMRAAGLSNEELRAMLGL